ncbi:LysR substrate-binding domain-containing protein [Oleisolibacter albus]|uniref:LysR substrate-binding domain-containing protein n=1 Tax=Oleisolibacter albus TaxID=2171757 RepID=UPI001EFD1C33|nr:LysR substrate-binding domain-containing protein [Oleisolibacter albus]
MRHEPVFTMTLAGLSLRDLEYVVAVADLHHFGKAAERCAVSQPSLSIQIRRLEERLAITLFERSARGVLLTPDGKRLVAQARIVLQEAQRFIDLAQGLAQGQADLLSGPLRLGAIPTLGPYLFPRLLRPLRQAFPRLQLILHEVRTQDLLEQLRAGEIDAAFLSPPVDAHGLVLEPLFFEPFLLAHSPGAAAADFGRLTLDSLPAEGLILLEEGHCLRDQALLLCSRRPAGSAGRHATSLDTLRHMVAAGEGWSILPALCIPDPDPLRDLLRQTPFDRPDVGRWISLAWRASSPRPWQFRTLAALVMDCAAGWCLADGRRLGRAMGGGVEEYGAEGPGGEGQEARG